MTCFKFCQKLLCQIVRELKCEFRAVGLELEESNPAIAFKWGWPLLERGLSSLRVTELTSSETFGHSNWGLESLCHRIYVARRERKRDHQP